MQQRWLYRAPQPLFEAWAATRLTYHTHLQPVWEVMQAWWEDSAFTTVDRTEVRRFLTQRLMGHPSASLGEPNNLVAEEAGLPAPMVLQSMPLAQRLVLRWQQAGLPALQLQQYLLIPEDLALAVLPGEAVLPTADASPEKTATTEETLERLSAKGKPQETAPLETKTPNAGLETPSLEEESFRDLFNTLPPEAVLPEEVYQPYAGVVLLHAFFPSLFSNLGWLDFEHQWRSEREQQWAVYAIHYLASGEEAPDEANLFVAKLLAG
ncbi:MAG TPA: hypothetical protein DCE41_26095, partial [Cytophagales bacterium]|nr:hypothetical protein [Cytophagales bacterium]